MKNRIDKERAENTTEESGRLQTDDDLFFPLSPESTDESFLYATLRYAYDEIYLLDFESGSFHQVYRNRNTRLVPVVASNMEGALRDAFGGRIHPGDHVQYAGLLDAARWSLAAGISDVLAGMCANWPETKPMSGCR